MAELIPPPILFFVLGAAAAALRSDLHLPESLAKTLSIYLMVAIGLKGGAALGTPGASEGLWGALGAGVVLSFLLPILAFALLRAASSLDRETAAAVSGHYGSVSVVTFATAIGTLNALGLPHEGFMPAVLAAMETPAIVTALLLANGAVRRHRNRASGPGAPTPLPVLLREVLLNGSIVLLLGSFAIGWFGGEPARAQFAPFAEALFPGALALFLLEMGLVAARQIRAAPGVLDARLFAFGLVMPLIGGALGLGAGLLVGLSVGGVALMAVLSASASYIAVPAAMRMALPKADAGVYVTLSLAVTFPFNVVAGIPIWIAAAQMVVG
ncbi:sodium-dependent bicarbonate transport family permease [Crenalkalicoccus roseus]|uniref:sodium-dependent bicarbonate transport family permease n=1 Tax=Crenalkalicoccus roseus TaxID=1485588 RepID=UPI0010801FBC|nr:sodium-dependent bicarbonate transport family permease [Crenalkalicoccus roseus]